MPKLTKGHYHCRECGALFQANVMKPEKQKCPVCGHPPTGRKLAASSALKTESLADTVGNQALQGAQGESVKRTKRKEKGSKAILVISSIVAQRSLRISANYL